MRCFSSRRARRQLTTKNQHSPLLPASHKLGRLWFSPHRFRRSCELAVLTHQFAEVVSGGDDEIADEARQFRHAVFGAIARHEVGSVKSFRLWFAGFVLGVIQGSEEENGGIGRFEPAFAVERLLAGIPKTVRLTPFEYDLFARAGILRLLSLELITQPAFGHRKSFILLIMDMHSRAGAGLHTCLDQYPVPVRLLHYGFEG